jgi:hypothetical protein
MVKPEEPERPLVTRQERPVFRWPGQRPPRSRARDNIQHPTSNIQWDGGTLQGLKMSGGFGQMAMLIRVKILPIFRQGA